MTTTPYFLSVLKKAEKKYGKDSKRLAGEGWEHDWQMLIATILSAQSRDESTIPIAEALFRKYHSLTALANAKYSDAFKILRSINYNKTKTRHVIAAAQFILKEFKGKIPDTLEDLLRIPGVGRKTANLVMIECHNKDGICVDTHVHRLSNVLGIVKTKTPEETEYALREISPKNYWSRINRIFVLWGKEVPGKDKNKLLKKLTN